MAKLVTNTNTALMGTGMNVLAKLVPVSEIKTIPELSEIFQRQDKVIEDIKKSMEESGFHKEEPIVIAKLTDGTVLGVADGNTRLIVAKEIGLDEVPVVYKTFDSLEDAIQYAKDMQFHRRNLSQAEIYNYANNLDAIDDRNGEGRAAERLAEELGISASTIEHARTVESRADEETKKKIKNNEMTINQAYQKVRKSKTKQDEETDERNAVPDDFDDISDTTDDSETDFDIDSDISDSLSDTSGTPSVLNFSHSDGIERPKREPWAEDESDRRLIERYREGKKDGLLEGFSKGAYAVYEKIFEFLDSGRTADEVRNDPLFEDFSPTVITKKFDEENPYDQ